ncbi:amicyanin [Amaricoccus macauensis]|uniref:Amicyanin n=1 Tax=Amaricoccus macauensis TaxID=57001 RepID=A0A840SRF7_9RHOB|nr:amicyanin [Amaricoccus macauensis]MBB5221913.1 amicyanin [Amaricoccus macauensis]
MNLALTTRSLAVALTIALAGASGAAAADAITPGETQIPASEAPADAVVVNIAKMKYETPDLKVAPGTTVVWVNQEAMPHNIAFQKGVVGDDAFEGAMLKKDEAYVVTFNEAGTYAYHCTPHPFMRGKVTVE